MLIHIIMAPLSLFIGWKALKQANGFFGKIRNFVVATVLVYVVGYMCLNAALGKKDKSESPSTAPQVEQAQ
jgi:putative Mn2+ efflux pump MntP